MDESEGFPGYAVRDRRWWNRQDDDAATDGEARVPSAMAALKAELIDRDRQLAESTARERAALAEVDRARARLERDAQREIERVRRDVLGSFLPVLDDLDRASQAARDGAPAEALAAGVELVRSSFLDRLRAQGVERFDPIGTPFDPTRHEAVGVVEPPEPDAAGLVVKTMTPGYVSGSETLRPARVVVAAAEPRSRTT